MDSAKIAYERVDGHENIIRIPLANINDADFVFGVLQDTFEACFQNKDAHFIVDLENLVDFPPALLALLIDATARARSLGGDVKIVNLSDDTKNRIAAFSVGSYLSMKDEEDAIEEFLNLDTAGQDGDSKEFEEHLHRTEAEHPSEEDLPVVDIAEDPIIAKLESRALDSSQVSEKPKHKARVKHKVEQKRGERNHLRVKSLAKNLYVICDFVLEYASRAGFDTKMIGKMRIAVYEACLNVIEHAYHSNPENWIDVWIEYNQEMFKIVIQDYGIGFEGFSDKQFDVMTAMDGRQTGGFGLYIIRRSMDEIEYRPDPKHGNRLTMIKFFQKKPGKDG